MKNGKGNNPQVSLQNVKNKLDDIRILLQQKHFDRGSDDFVRYQEQMNFILYACLTKLLIALECIYERTIENKSE